MYKNQTHKNVKMTLTRHNKILVPGRNIKTNKK